MGISADVIWTKVGGKMGAGAFFRPFASAKTKMSAIETIVHLLFFFLVPLNTGIPVPGP
jgi:hypothetical protein